MDIQKGLLKALDVYIGKWNTQGLTREGWQIKGTDTYHWLAGGYFLIHDVDVTSEVIKNSALEITGYDQESRSLKSYSYDQDGNISTSTWKIKGNEISILAATERFKGAIKDEGKTIEGIWEQFDGTKWKGWMNIQLTKQIT